MKPKPPTPQPEPGLSSATLTQARGRITELKMRFFKLTVLETRGSKPVGFANLTEGGLYEVWPADVAKIEIIQISIASSHLWIINLSIDYRS